MNPLDHDAWLTSGPGGPDQDDGPDYACTQAEYNTVQKVFEEMGGQVFAPDLPDEIIKAINDARQTMAEWMECAEKQGVEPTANDKQCDRYGV